MLSDFLNVTLEEASSNKLSEATNFSAMAQASFPTNVLPTAGPVIGSRMQTPFIDKDK